MGRRASEDARRALRTEVTLRAAVADDCDGLAALLVETFAFYGDTPSVGMSEMARRLRRHLGAEPGFEALLVEGRAGLLGFAIFAPVFWTTDCSMALFLKELFLREQARGHGIGRRLMAELARVALARGWTRIVWTADRNNGPAQRFYESLPAVRRLDKLFYMQAETGLRQLTLRDRGFRSL